MTLGFKGLGLKQMAAYGHRVPEGFVLSTELFGAVPAMSYPPLYDDTIQRVQRGAARARAPDAACGSATRAGCCCSPSAPARRSPCRAS